jgi:uncharacterized OsmC-like protein
MSESEAISLTITQESDYEFRVRFDDTTIGELVADEQPPLGHGAGPDPMRLLIAAIGSCLGSSLLFALRKFKNTPGTIVARMRAYPTRNEHGRRRIGHIAAEIQLPENAGDYKQIERIIAQFEDFCVVTQSVRAGIAVEVTVIDGEGAVLVGEIPSA